MSYSGNPNLKINLVKFWHDSQTCSSIFSYLIHISCIHSYSLSYLMYSFLFSYLFISYHIFFIHLIYLYYQVLLNLSGSSSFRTFQLRIFGFPKLLHDWVCASRALVCLSDKQHSSFEQCTDTILSNLTPFLLCNLSNS